jgi:site-specific DNA recombinase
MYTSGEAPKLKQTFDSLATGGYIGDVDGKPAYAYIRVSSDEQAERGYGLQRQIEHCHEVARDKGYRISWDMIYFDDYTGFEFEERPALSQLRKEYQNGKRADTIVIEHLDRLSRNSDWHQGYLLWEMEQHGLQAVFWKAFNSRVERSVMGAVAQDAMEQARQRMLEGNINKAKSGKVTAKTPAYGLKFVDSQGNEGHTAIKDRHYALRDDIETETVRTIYKRVAAGDAIRRVAGDLNENGVRPPGRSKMWTPELIRVLIKNPVYRGDFYASRWAVIKEGQKDKRRVLRPESEWIHVTVPAIVSHEIWQQANDMLAKNKQTSSRNAKHSYLLTGLIKCAHCDLAYHGNFDKRRKEHYKDLRYYRCSQPYEFTERECDNTSIQCDVLDNAVWSIVCDALLKPDVVLQALESDALSEHNQSLLRQIEWLGKEIAGKSNEDDKLYRAFVADVFDAQEYKERRDMLTAERQRLSDKLLQLKSQVIAPDKIEARRKIILDMADRLLQMRLHIPDPPFDLKQKIIKMVVDRVVLNVRDGWFRLEGTLQGQHSIENIPVSRNNHNQLTGKHNLRFVITYDLNKSAIQSVRLAA